MNIREYITTTQLYKKELTIPSDMTVDHADNNVSNNCTWNLSLMTRSENGEKGNLFSDLSM